MQALIMNRVGDMMLSIGLFAMFSLVGNLDYFTAFATIPHVNEIAITVITILLFIGATAKSAQIPLHVWLPGSMEGLIGIINYLFSIYIKILIYLLFFILLTFFYIDFISIEFYSLLDLSLSPLAPVLVINKPRSISGKFISVPTISLEPLSPIVKEALTGELLGDGCLRYTKKVQEGNPNPN